MLHRLGAFLGVCAFWFGPTYRRKLRTNLRQAGLDEDRVMPVAVRHAGMQAVEMAWVWKRSNADVMAHIAEDESAAKIVAEAVAEGKSLIFMTPHVGCYEVSPWGRNSRSCTGNLSRNLCGKPLPTDVSAKAWIRPPRICRACGKSSVRCARAAPWGVCLIRCRGGAKACGLRFSGDRLLR